MKLSQKIISGIAAISLAVTLAACEKKESKPVVKKQDKVEQVQKVEKKGSITSVDERVSALEKRVKSLEVSRADVRKYLKDKENELKAKGL